MKKVVIAVDSFKGSLSAAEAVNTISDEIKKLHPDWDTLTYPMADGGEGTMSILADLCQGELVECQVNGPLMNPVSAQYAMINGDTAVIEMAAASGLLLINEKDRNPEKTTTLGTGELIAHALKRGIRKFFICLGGSATNDGGIGAAAALGVKFLDKAGRELLPVGESLARVNKIDIAHMMDAAMESEYYLMCDVTNPLTGPTGAVAFFSEQKGADESMKLRLEEGMIHYAEKLKEQMGFNANSIPGSGAAGGLAAGLMCFLKSSIVSGISKVIEVSGLEKAVQDADLVISGEGRADRQSVNGKVMSGVGKLALKYRVPAFGITGCLGEGYEELLSMGFKDIIPCKEDNMDVDYAMTHGRELLAARTRELIAKFD